MGTKSLQRTIRRCVALLLAPIALLVAVISQYLGSPYGPSAPMDVLTIGEIVGLALFVGAVGYLIASLALTLRRPEDSQGTTSKQDTGA